MSQNIAGELEGTPEGRSKQRSLCEANCKVRLPLLELSAETQSCLSLQARLCSTLYPRHEWGMEDGTESLVQAVLDSCKIQTLLLLAHPFALRALTAVKL